MSTRAARAADNRAYGRAVIGHLRTANTNLPGSSTLIADPITHEAITVTNDTYINQWVFGEFLDKIADAYAGTDRPITLVLDNARYQKCQSVADKAKELGIELLYLPAYSPNLNLIERLWRFVKKQVLYSIHYDKFEKFRKSIDTCIAELSTRFKANMQT